MAKTKWDKNKIRKEILYTAEDWAYDEDNSYSRKEYLELKRNIKLKDIKLDLSHIKQNLLLVSVPKYGIEIEFEADYVKL